MEWYLLINNLKFEHKRDKWLVKENHINGVELDPVILYPLNIVNFNLFSNFYFSYNYNIFEIVLPKNKYKKY